MLRGVYLHPLVLYNRKLCFLLYKTKGKAHSHVRQDASHLALGAAHVASDMLDQILKKDILMAKKSVNKNKSIADRANLVQTAGKSAVNPTEEAKPADKTVAKSAEKAAAKPVEKAADNTSGKKTGNANTVSSYRKMFEEEEKPEPLKGGKKFFNRMDKLGDIFFLNLRVALCCIPIVTIGAAFTALYSVTNKMVDDKEGKVGKEYWKAFKSNFHEATIAWLINLVYILLMYVQFRYVSTANTQGANILMIVLGFEVILLCFELPLLFPMIARYENKPLNHIINSIVFSIANFGTWFRMFFLWVIPDLIYYLRPTLLVYTWYLWALFLTAFFAYICSMFLKKFYAKLEGSGKADTEKYASVSSGADSDDADNIDDVDIVDDEGAVVASEASGEASKSDKEGKSASKDDAEPYSKVGYFRDYYLKYVILGILIIVVGVYIVKDVMNGSKNILAEGTAVNAHFTESEVEKLKEGLFEKLEGDAEKDEVIFVNEYDIVLNGSDMDQISVNQSTTELFNYINSNTLDYLILDEESLKYYNEYDAFMNLEYILTDEQKNELSDRMVYIPVGINLLGKNMDQYSKEDEGGTDKTIDNPVLPVALDISDSEIFAEKRDTRMYLVFTSARPKTENMQKLVDYIIK